MRGDTGFGLAAAALGLLAAGCASVSIPVATQADVARAARERPETTLADLEQGRSLYLSRCSACHRPVPPDSASPQEWPEHVAEMQERAHLQPAEADLVVLYLVTMSASPPSSAVAQPASAAARAARR